MGEVGEGRATSSINERVGVGCVGMGKRVPSCPRKDEVGMERGLQEGGREGAECSGFGAGHTPLKEIS